MSGALSYFFGDRSNFAQSIGLYNLAVNRGIENPWLAWIPIADLYIMGLLVGEMDLFGYHLDNLGLWVPVIFVGGWIMNLLTCLAPNLLLSINIFRSWGVNRYLSNMQIFMDGFSDLAGNTGGRCYFFQTGCLYPGN